MTDEEKTSERPPSFFAPKTDQEVKEHELVSGRLSETAYLLYAKYGRLTLGASELAEVLHMSHGRSFTALVGSGRCPFKTFMVAGSRVADIRDVAAYLDGQRNGAKHG